jgi:hypothetical protein
MIKAFEWDQKHKKKWSGNWWKLGESIHTQTDRAQPIVHFSCVHAKKNFLFFHLYRRCDWRFLWKAKLYDQLVDNLDMTNKTHIHKSFAYSWKYPESQQIPENEKIIKHLLWIRILNFKLWWNLLEHFLFKKTPNSGSSIH